MFGDIQWEVRLTPDIDRLHFCEHWFNNRRWQWLVDEINTSDEVILGLMEGREVLNVRYLQRKKLMDRFTRGERRRAPIVCWMRWWQRGQKPLM